MRLCGAWTDWVTRGDEWSSKGIAVDPAGKIYFADHDRITRCVSSSRVPAGTRLVNSFGAYCCRIGVVRA